VEEKEKLRVSTAIRTQETIFDEERNCRNGDVSDLIIHQAHTWHDLRRAVHYPSQLLGIVRCRAPGMVEGLDMAYTGSVKLSSRPCGGALHRSARGDGKELREFGEVATEVGGEMVGGPGW
jgi:hypothetical protein